MKPEARSQKPETTLVCFALNEEATPFRKMIADRSDMTILLTGIGRINAQKVVRKFLANSSPQLVLSCGFAGALKPDLNLGAVVFTTDNDEVGKRLSIAGAR